MKIRSNSISRYHQSFGDITALWDWDYVHEHSALKIYLVKYGVVHLWLIPDLETRNQALHNSSLLLSMFEDGENELFFLHMFRALSIEFSRTLFEEVISKIDQQTYVQGRISRDPLDMKYHRFFLMYGDWLRHFVFFLSQNGFPILGMRLGEIQLGLVEQDEELHHTKIDILEELLSLYEVLELETKAQKVRDELMFWYEKNLDDVRVKYSWLRIQFYSLEKIEDKIQNIHQRMALTSDTNTLLSLEYDIINCQRIEMGGYSAKQEIVVQDFLQRIPPENKDLRQRCKSLQCKMLITKEDLSKEEHLFIEKTATEILQDYILFYGEEHPKSLGKMSFISEFYNKIGDYEKSLHYLQMRHPHLVKIYGEEHVFSSGNLLEQGICNINLKRYEDVSQVIQNLVQLSNDYSKKIFDQEDRNVYFASLVVDILWSKYREHKTPKAKSCIVQAYKDIAQIYMHRKRISRELWKCWYRIYFFNILQSRVLRFLWEMLVCFIIIYGLFMIFGLVDVR